VKRRYDYLTIGMICLLLAVLVLAGIARAETTAYVTLTGQGAGYDPAVGLRLDHTTDRWAGVWALHGSARADLRKKYSAEDGHTYSVLASVRAYLPPAPMIYLSAGAAVAGYRSEFATGTVWSKDTVHPVVGIGYDTDAIDLDLAYYAREHSTPNEVEAFKLCGAAKIHGDWKLLLEVTGMRWLQGQETMTDAIWQAGVGYEF